MDLHANMVKEAPVDHGFLSGSIEFPIRVKQLVFGIRIGAKYWIDVQFGTKPHIIEPVNGDALSFVFNGEQVVFKRVRHPGTAPNPFIDRALDKTGQRTKEFVERTLEELVG